MTDASTIVLDRLSPLVDHIPAASRVLLLTSPRRRHLAHLEAVLEGRPLAVFDQAAVHVPAATVAAADRALRDHRAEVIISVGGGAATGLGKALKLSHPDVIFAAVPTTYAGSEMTRIFGITEGAEKRTGRDDRVRPTVVVHDPSLLSSLPRAVAVKSMLNALAHPVSALTTGSLDERATRDALHAVQRIVFAVRQLIAAPDLAEVRAGALSAAALAGRVLDNNPMGLHHKLVHALGGAHDLPHADLHAVLLVHTLAHVADRAPELADRLAAAARTPELAAFVFDTLARVDAPRSLRGLGLDRGEVRAAAGPLDVPGTLLDGAHVGSRPLRQHRRTTWAGVPVVIDGDFEQADTVFLALHGRGSDATRAVAHLREALGHRRDLAIVAPQADGDAWVALPYNAPADQLAGPLDEALARAQSVAAELRARAGGARFGLYGFSQGACLALELLMRGEVRPDFAIALCGARPGGERPIATLTDVPVLLSIGQEDAWVRHEDVAATAQQLEQAGAAVTALHRPGAAHTVTDRDRVMMRRLVGGQPPPPHGFGGHHTVEALPGAVPREQNSPRRSPYGLYPEQLSGTGFVAARHENLRTWVYRVRPSAQHGAFDHVPHPTLTATVTEHASINLEAWESPGGDVAQLDFVDGLVTVGGAGHPSLRRGYAVHLYRAGRDMDNRSFTNADGDMVIVPQAGELTVLTELGELDVGPGRVLVIPRGLRFSVLLHDDIARGYVGEIYARHFVLPERGPIGANSLADERHFVGPTPFYEDRLSVGHVVSSKMGGALYEAKQDHSPWDVAGWHGAYVPYTFDLSRFVPVSNSRVDHTDPAAFTVLSAGLDEQGAHALDLVVFPARWDPTEHTFRPPYFHRNVTTEINGIVRDPGLRPPFSEGMLFLTPSMTAHGVRAGSVDAHLARSDEAADKPMRTSNSALWFQFETALPFCKTRWAEDADEARHDWPRVWGEYGTWFDPRDDAS